MASPITKINPRGINTTGDYVVNSISSTGNVTAGNIKSDHLLYANGSPYAFTTNAAGTNTQVQFNDGNSFAGDANLTFNKTTGTLTANFFVGNGSQLTGLPASYTDTNANSAIDARVTKSFIDNLGVNANTLNGHSDTYFATSTQGALADSALQPADLTGYATESYVTGAIANIPGTDLTGYATESYVGNAVANLVNSAPSVLDTLGELANAIGNDASFTTTITNSLANKANTADLSTVAISGNYEDLNNLPTLFDGTYANLTGKPNLFDGEYVSLANKPTLFSGSYVDLTDKPSLFDGEYLSLANRPSLATVATSGSYTDLIDKPSLFDGEYASLANKPALFDGTYANLTGKPTLGTAASTDSTAYATAAQGTKADTALQPADLTGYATESYVTGAIANIPSTDLSSYATQTYVNTQISNLVDAAPATLDTLNELAAALGDDPNFATTIANSIGNKLSTSDFTSTADTWLVTKTTSNVSEGTNLYFTDARANTAIDNRVTKTFVDNLSVVANIANVAYSVDSSNVVGQVGNSLIAGTVYTNAQPNITSVGALTSLSVTGTLSLGSIANLYIPGGSNNYVIKTDGAGNLSWVAQTISGNASISGSDTQIFFNNAGNTTLGSSSNLTFNKTTNTLTTTNFVASGTTNLGAIGNVTVTGGSANNYLKTDGSGTLSWGELPTTSVTLDAFTGNGVQTGFTLTTTPTSKDYTIAVVAGIVQPKATYSVSGTTLTFSEAPPNTAPVEITTFNTGVSAPTGGGSGSGYTYQGISANTTLVVATRYIVNTSASELTLTLPTTANLGDEIGIIDGTGNADIHNITVNPNGGNIMGTSGNIIVSTTRAAFTLVYYNATQGWLLTQV